MRNAKGFDNLACRKLAPSGFNSARMILALKRTAGKHGFRHHDLSTCRKSDLRNESQQFPLSDQAVWDRLWRSLLIPVVIHSWR